MGGSAIQAGMGKTALETRHGLTRIDCQVLGVDEVSLVWQVASQMVLVAYNVPLEKFLSTHILQYMVSKFCRQAARCVAQHTWQQVANLPGFQRCQHREAENFDFAKIGSE